MVNTSLKELVQNKIDLLKIFYWKSLKIGLETRISLKISQTSLNSSYISQLSEKVRLFFE